MHEYVICGVRGLEFVGEILLEACEVNVLYGTPTFTGAHHAALVFCLEADSALPNSAACEGALSHHKFSLKIYMLNKIKKFYLGSKRGL